MIYEHGYDGDLDLANTHACADRTHDWDMLEAFWICIHGKNYYFHLKKFYFTALFSTFGNDDKQTHTQCCGKSKVKSSETKPKKI